MRGKHNGDEVKNGQGKRDVGDGQSLVIEPSAAVFLAGAQLLGDVEIGETDQRAQHEHGINGQEIPAVEPHAEADHRRRDAEGDQIAQRVDPFSKHSILSRPVFAGFGHRAVKGVADARN